MKPQSRAERRAEWIAQMVAIGVPEGAAGIAYDEAVRAQRRFPPYRYPAAALRAVKMIQTKMHRAKLRARAVAA